MAFQNPPPRMNDEDDESDDPIDMLSSKSRTRSYVKAGSPRAPSQSLLNPTTDFPIDKNHAVTSSSQGLDLLSSHFGQLHLSQINSRTKPHQRQWPTSLTPAQQLIVDKALRPNNETIYDLPGASCGIKELQILSLPAQWINDEIINYYGSLINLQSQNQRSLKALDVHCFSSFFMSQFDLGGHQNVQRWTRKINLFQKDLILFPINLSNLHWVLGVINIQQKRFEYYDSLGGSNSKVLLKLRRYYKDEYQTKNSDNADLAQWTDYQPEVPLQSNSSDCGVFVCQFMHSLSQNSIHQDAQEPMFDFTAKNMPYLRQKMILEIISKAFLPDNSPESSNQAGTLNL
ncbi:hypothetical protein, variant 1 [Puccinia triticina 1-1 BBBD Race 1]|uniref:ULP_PROTEASE domain-containing protein n=1 Tax=Puccinia triticina (isolate 1-1 / race 1 (BBBD)) TaxID=630390 RepID=A0A180GRL5_PUCT1|nr:hypothetical protein, variant 1 [Puccinia triticina 1-1 BBBD Race 1]